MGGQCIMALSLCRNRHQQQHRCWLSSGNHRRHLYRHLYKHVYRRAYRYVYRHMCVGTYVDMFFASRALPFEERLRLLHDALLPDCEPSAVATRSHHSGASSSASAARTYAFAAATSSTAGVRPTADIASVVDDRPDGRRDERPTADGSVELSKSQPLRQTRLDDWVNSDELLRAPRWSPRPQASHP